MSLEAKEAHREKSKFAIQMRCKLETKEQTASQEQQIDLAN